MSWTQERQVQNFPCLKSYSFWWAAVSAWLHHVLSGCIAFNVKLALWSHWPEKLLSPSNCSLLCSQLRGLVPRSVCQSFKQFIMTNFKPFLFRTGSCTKKKKKASFHLGLKISYRFLPLPASSCALKVWKSHCIPGTSNTWCSEAAEGESQTYLG